MQPVANGLKRPLTGAGNSFHAPLQLARCRPLGIHVCQLRPRRLAWDLKGVKYDGFNKVVERSRDPVVVNGSAAEIGVVGGENFPSNENLNWEWRKQMAKKILTFALPALAIPLADPLLSVVDTLCVSQYAGTVELAALGPNTAIYHFANYTFHSLGIATITIVSTLMSKGKTEEASSRLTASLFTALFFGVISMLGLIGFGSGLIGATGVDPVVGVHAVSYLKIRALAQPAALCIIVCQAGLLGQKDSVTPFATVMLACVINIFGDIFLITKFGMGVVGAAIATVVAEYCEVGVMLIVLRSRKVGPKMVFPSWSKIESLIATWLPLVMDYICKGSCYLSIQWAASGLKLLDLAAHQAMWAWWNMAAFCQMPVKDSALAFIPAAKSKAERIQISYLIIAFGILAGLLTSTAASLFPYWVPQFFSPDKVLWPLIQSVCFASFLALMCSGVDSAMVGLLYANDESVFVAWTMAANFVMITAYLTICKYVSFGLVGIWGGLVLFFAMRVVWSTSRIVSRHLGLGVTKVSDEGNEFFGKVAESKGG